MNFSIIAAIICAICGIIMLTIGDYGVALMDFVFVALNLWCATL